ncbi:MAG: hypothetical protein ABIS29_04005 [Vicinamibacterales bacterium]
MPFSRTSPGGILGLQADRAGGVPTFLLGVGLHFLIGIIWATVFWLLARVWPVLVRRPVFVGLGYGVVIFYAMYQVVLPLSALHTPAWPIRWLPVDLFSHMLLVGVPIAVTVARGEGTTNTIFVRFSGRELISSSCTAPRDPVRCACDDGVRAGALSTPGPVPRRLQRVLQPAPAA